MMTKKERAAVDAMAAELAKLQAYLVEMDAPDKDVPVPSGSTLAFGWGFNVHNVSGILGVRDAVYKVTSGPTSHYDGGHKAEKSYSGGWSQRGVASYSTRRRALQALRAEVCRQHAATLAKIDAEIEREPA